MQPLEGEIIHGLTGVNAKPDDVPEDFGEKDKSQRHLTSKKIFAKHEREKKRQYNNGIMNVEHGTFTPLVFYLNGGLAKECLKFHKFVAEKIANNYRYENFFNNQVQTFIPHSSCSSNVRERQSLLHNTFREPSSR